MSSYEGKRVRLILANSTPKGEGKAFSRGLCQGGRWNHNRIHDERKRASLRGTPIIQYKFKCIACCIPSLNIDCTLSFSSFVAESLLIRSHLQQFAASMDKSTRSGHSPPVTTFTPETKPDNPSSGAEDVQTSNGRVAWMRIPTSNLEEGIVGWDTEDDPEMHSELPRGKKWVIVALVSAITFVTPFASSILSPGIGRLSKDFGNTNSAVGTMTVSIYLLGYVLGPLFLGLSQRDLR